MSVLYLASRELKQRYMREIGASILDTSASQIIDHTLCICTYIPTSIPNPRYGAGMRILVYNPE